MGMSNETGGKKEAGVFEEAFRPLIGGQTL